MSILNPLTWGRRPKIEQKASAAGSAIVPWGMGNAIWTPRDYDKLTRESYLVNAIAFRCVKMIATAAATPRLLLYNKRGDWIENHPMLDLLHRPAPMASRAFTFEMLYSYLLLSGNTYMEKVGPNGKPPRELYVQRPDRMKVVPGPYGIPRRFVYENQGKKVHWDVNPMTGESDILQIREFHPLDDWYGMSRVEPAAWAVDRHNAASEHNKALLDNGGRPSGALIFEPVNTLGNAGTLNAPPEVIEMAEKELRERHVGARNAGRPMVLGGNVRWEEMGISPRDMDFDENKQDAARDICNAWGVPHVLLVRGASTYNNLKEAKLELYEETVLPLVEHVTSELNNWLVPLYGDELYLEPDYDSITALEPRREVRRQSITDLIEHGVIDPDEGRDDLGYGKRDPNAVRKIDGSVLTALITASEAVGMTPLLRYMKSVGLVSPDATEEGVMAEALALLENDDETDDDDDTNVEDDDNDDAN